VTCAGCGAETPERATFCACGRALPALRSVNLSPQATPTHRANHLAPRRPREAMNSWEAGIAGEHRPGGTFMPYVNETGTPIGVHDWQHRRAAFESAGLA
jgi:hypothetical protein